MGAAEPGCRAPLELLYVVRVTTFTSIAAFAANADASAGPADAQARVREAITQVLERARADNASQRIYTRILDSRAFSTLERLRSAGSLPLYGIPVAIKDNIDVQGVETSCGRRLTPGNASASAVIVERLESLGAIIIGKTNLDEAALGASGRNPRFGRCANPRFADRLSGGSSSGSAAAVAAGHALLGVGTDTLGSVRIPAAFCGIAGFKPSRGQLSMAGIAPLYPRFDSVGFLAASLADIVHVAAVMLGRNTPHGTARSAVGDAELNAVCRISVLDDAALDAVQMEVATGYRQCTLLLQELREIEICAAPPLDWTALARAAFWEVAHEFAECSAGASLGSGTAGHRALPGYRSLLDIDGDLGRVLAKAISRPATKLADGRILIQHSASRLQHCLHGAEAVLTPTCPQNAPSVHEDPVNHIAAFTAPANAAGLPAVVWRQRLAAAGAQSLQLIGRHGDDLKLLDLALRVQRHLDRQQGFD
jgi:Asp-tRNA(Asn)/Glu-tRNA(Gln) amidotransferase A subunit family amidase